MSIEDQLAVFLCALGGLAASVLNFMFAMLTQLTAWRRGHFRIGFLHGIFLGPLGLLTVQLHMRRNQPTAALMDQINRCRPYSQGLFVVSFVLLMLCVSIVNTQIIFFVFKHGPLPALNIWVDCAVVLAGLGMIAFTFSCPLLSRMPPLDDYDEYPDDPEFSYQVKQASDSHSAIAQTELYRLLALACGFLLVLPGLAGIICLVANGSVNLKPAGMWLTGIAVASGIGLAYCISRYFGARRLLESAQAVNMPASPEWPPSVPMSVRRHFLRMQLDLKIQQRALSKVNLGLAVCRYSLPTVAVLALIGYWVDTLRFPFIVDYVSILLGAVAIGYSIVLTRHHRDVVESVKELLVKTNDVAFVMDHMVLANEPDEHPAAPILIVDQGLSLEFLDECRKVGMRIPADEPDAGDELRIPELSFAYDPSSEFIGLMNAAQAIRAIGMTAAINLFVLSAIRNIETSTFAYFLMIVAVLIISAVLERLADRYAPEIALASKWQRYEIRSK